MVTDGYQTYLGDHFTIYVNVKPLCCIPETDTILYVNKKRTGHVIRFKSVDESLEKNNEKENGEQ